MAQKEELSPEQIDELVARMIEYIQAKWKAPPRKDRKLLHKAAKVYIQLRNLGETGDRAIERLLEHEDPGVRCTSAIWTNYIDAERSLRILREICETVEPPSFVLAQAGCTLSSVEHMGWSDPTKWKGFTHLYKGNK